MPLYGDKDRLDCPGCHYSDPLNFKLEKRYTLRERKESGNLEILNTVEVMVCIKCNRVLGPLNREAGKEKPAKL